MDGKVLREFPDGSKMIETRDGSVAFVVDPEKYDDRMWERGSYDIDRVAKMVGIYAKVARTDKHILKGLNNIASGYAYTRLPPRYEEHLKHEVGRFMDGLRQERMIENWRLDVDTHFRTARLEYFHYGTREARQVQVAMRCNTDLLVGRLDALIDDGYGVDLSKFVFPPKEKLQEMAGIKAVPKHVPKDQQYGYMAKGYGCKDPDKCVTPHPHYVADCKAKIADIKAPVPFMTAKEICEAQPMSTFKEEVYKIKVEYDKHTHPTGVGPTQPPVMDLRMQRKKDGLCPECGDIKRESAVGVCRDHGKFMG